MGLGERKRRGIKSVAKVERNSHKYGQQSKGGGAPAEAVMEDATDFIVV